MRSIQEQACPLCGAEAEFKPVRVGWKHFVCPECGDYNISARAEDELTKRPELMPEFSRLAKSTNAEDVFEVYTEPTPTGRSELRCRVVARTK